MVVARRSNNLNSKQNWFYDKFKIKKKLSLKSRSSDLKFDLHLQTEVWMHVVDDRNESQLFESLIVKLIKVGLLVFTLI